jgi:hypothetical protein
MEDWERIKNVRWREFCCFVGCSEERIVCWLDDPQTDGWKNFQVIECRDGAGITIRGGGDISCQYHGRVCQKGFIRIRHWGALCPRHAELFPETGDKSFYKVIEEADPESFDTKRMRAPVYWR